MSQRYTIADSFHLLLVPLLTLVSETIKCVFNRTTSCMTILNNLFNYGCVINSRITTYSSVWLNLVTIFVDFTTTFFSQRLYAFFDISIDDRPIGSLLFEVRILKSSRRIIVFEKHIHIQRFLISNVQYIWLTYATIITISFCYPTRH